MPSYITVNRLERILTMVYVVQNYLASFGLCPSSTLPHPPEDGDRSSLRNVVIFCKTST
jgi:hypothetical protein